MYIYFRLQLTNITMPMFMAKDDKNALRCNLRASIFQNFPGGACPQTSLEGACYTSTC